MKTPLLLAKRAASSASVCLSCRRSLLRQLSSSAAARGPAAAFRPYPLNPRPASPPRNAGAPDTSITRPVESPPLPRVHDTRPPQHAHGGGAGVRAAVSEREAQTSQPAFAGAAAASSSPPPSTAAAGPNTPSPSTISPTATAPGTAPAAKPAAAARPPRASRLRAPRKAAMKLTPSAVAHLQALLEGPEPKLIKVGVRNRGCSGLAYHLEYVDGAGAFDETVEQDGVRVLIDSKALFSIIGSEMDWVEDKLNQRFVFRNPNIKEQCGCGESFMV